MLHYAMSGFRIFTFAPCQTVCNAPQGMDGHGLARIRGPRPPSVHWPQAQNSQPPPREQLLDARRGQWRPPSHQRRQSTVPLPRQEPVDPDTAMAHARAMEAVRESDPTYPAVVDALKRARTQAQVRPVADSISATESFLERAWKRVEKERKEVDRATAELAKAGCQLVLEEESLREGKVASTLSKWVSAESTCCSPCRFCSGIGAIEESGTRVVAGAGPVEVPIGRADVQFTRRGSSKEGKVVGFSLSKVDDATPTSHWRVVENHRG